MPFRLWLNTRPKHINLYCNTTRLPRLQDSARFHLSRLSHYYGDFNVYPSYLCKLHILSNDADNMISIRNSENSCLMIFYPSRDFLINYTLHCVEYVMSTGLCVCMAQQLLQLVVGYIDSQFTRALHYEHVWRCLDDADDYSCYTIYYAVFTTHATVLLFIQMHEPNRIVCNVCNRNAVRFYYFIYFLYVLNVTQTCVAREYVSLDFQWGVFRLKHRFLSHQWHSRPLINNRYCTSNSTAINKA